MSSFGLPALAIHTQEQPSVVDKYSKLIQLRGLMARQALEPGQQQLQQQQIQSGQLEVQQQQRDAQDQQTVQQVLGAHQGDLDTALPELAGKVSAKTYLGLQKAHLDIRKTIAEIGDKELETQKDENGRLLGLISQAKQLPPDQYAQQWPQIAQQALQIKPKLAGHVNPQQPIPQQALDQLGIGVMTQAQYESKELAKRAAAKAGPELAEVTAKAAQAQKVLAGTSATGLTAEQQATLAQGNKRIGIEGAQLGLARGRLGIEQGRLDVEQGKLAIEKQKAGPIPLEQITNTTKAGRQYISAEDVPKESIGTVRQQAAAAGIPVVNKDTAGILSDIDNAKTNQQYMLDTIGKKLASGAPERLWYGPANTLEKMAQTDPEMAAVGTFRTAAIQSMRAVAGSKGLRINRAEIQMAIDNDVPKLTDTLPAAQNKLKNMQQFLENTEASHLVRNRQANAPQQVQIPQVSGKTLSSAAIQQAAKDHGVSVEEATRQAKAVGYNIQ